MQQRTVTHKPEDFSSSFAANFNSRNIEAVLAGYADDAVLNLGSSNVLRGKDQIRQALTNFLAPQLPIVVKPLTHTISGTSAVVTFDWSISGKAPDGSSVEMRGRAVDVLRQESNGEWKQLLDLPFGTATI